jgi:DNA invertase Pin-like site-specific DNA recombinase
VDAKAQFRSLAEPWADTGTSTGRLMIAVLGGLADVERDLIRTRTAEGRSRAQTRGQRMGRPSKLMTHKRPRPAGDVRRVPRSRNSRSATMWAIARFQGSRSDRHTRHEENRRTIFRLTA